MLQVRDIRKQYKTGDLVQTALDGVSLNLRDNEFVAILGPSGSGKTTLLNVIGGLDRYDSGDLIINGISTKKYSDRDWDSYRNHTIGFVFQSYNLIPHQSVLANVELALTISGISPGERKRRAKKALEDVGLGNQLHKKPNQMSGGQMQRVAIARALVNDPDILLADEPTGALDSETSVQVMDLLQEVSQNRLVVMVTHNPELAEEYANRIVRVKDGRIIDDTNPLELEAGGFAAPMHKNMGHSSMSFLTALSLSFNNLRTKLARTLLTAFAGSIGIIGIALIISLSTGFQKYIDKIQADTLSNYPLTLQAETADMTSALAAFGTAAGFGETVPEGVVAEQQMISAMFSQIGTNDLASFKTHLETEYDTISHTIAAIKYGYGISPRIYAEDLQKPLQVNPSSLMSQISGGMGMASLMSSSIFYEMVDNIELLQSQYDVVRGRWPESYNEMVFVLTDPSHITDFMAYSLGMKDPDELQQMILQVMQGESIPEDMVPMQWSYEDLLALKFRLVDASRLYRYNTEYEVWEDMSEDKAYMQQLLEGAETLSIVGIVCPKDGVSATILSTGIAYTSDLTEYVVNQASQSSLVTSQLANSKVDVFTGKPFGAQEEESQLKFEEMISIDGDAISSAFGMNINTDQIMQLLKSYLSQVLGSMDVDTTQAQNDFLSALRFMGNEMLQQFVAANTDESGYAKLYLSDAEGLVDAYLATGSAQAQIQKLASTYGVGETLFSQVYRPLLVGLVSSCVSADQEQVVQDLKSSPSPATDPATEPPVTEPEVTEAPPTEPPATEPEVTEAPATEPPATEPEVTEAPATEPPATEPEVTEAPATEPPATEPEVTEAPATEPPATEPEVTEAPPTEPPATEPEVTEAPPTEPPATEPEIPTIPTVPEIDTEPLHAKLNAALVEQRVSAYVSGPVATGTASLMGAKMMEQTALAMLSQKMSGFGNVLGGYIGSAFYVDEEKLASAFQFNMNEEELQRLMSAMSTKNQQPSAAVNLQTLGYADLESPTSISIYLKDFAKKEEFIAFLDGYNQDMEEAGQEEQVIRYTDITGIMMSSVRTIIDSVSYALIAFVAVSLVVSSIMIGIITYISVMERTKEIGVLRAIGASKRNISQVFNAETFIIGLCSGLIGIGVTLLALIPGNMLIQHLTNNPDIVAQLPASNALVLILLSMVLTLIGGFIPARQAAKKDPVIALRSE